MKTDSDRLMEKIRARVGSSGDRVDLPSAAAHCVFPPVKTEDVTAAEQAIGFALPILLKSMYHEIGNGGFGPGFGTLGISNGQADAEGRNVVDLYSYYRKWSWPERLLPLWDWGDGARSCLDCSTAEGTIVTQDESGFVRTSFNLENWFETWADGVALWDRIFESEEGEIRNPFSKQAMVVRKRGRAKGK